MWIVYRAPPAWYGACYSWCASWRWRGVSRSDSRQGVLTLRAGTVRGKLWAYQIIFGYRKGGNAHKNPHRWLLVAVTSKLADNEKIGGWPTVSSGRWTSNTGAMTVSILHKQGWNMNLRGQPVMPSVMRKWINVNNRRASEYGGTCGKKEGVEEKGERGWTAEVLKQ